jgi:threonyl-tRNA synthetase
VRIVTVSEKFTEYAQSVEKSLKDAGFRVSGDYRPEKIGAKIRDGSLEKVPYLLIIGEKEQTSGTVSLRDESIKDMKARDVGSLPVAEVIARLRKEVDEKAIRNISTASAGLSDSEAKYAG